MDRRAGVGLGHEQHAPLARFLQRRAGDLGQGAGHIGIGAQQAEARPGDGGELACRVIAGQGVVAGTEEGEVVVGHPVEEVRGAFALLRRDTGGSIGAQLGGQRRGPGRHLGPVLDGLLHIAEHARESGRDLSAMGGVTLAVDLDVDPRLAHLAEGGRRGRVRVIALIKDELLVAAVGTAAHHQQRMEDRMDASARRFEVGGHGVDQEGLVVRHDLDDRMGTGPALAIDRGVEAGDRRGAGWPSLGQIVVGQGNGEQVIGASCQNLLGGRPCTAATLGTATKPLQCTKGVIARSPARVTITLRKTHSRRLGPGVSGGRRRPPWRRP